MLMVSRKPHKLLIGVRFSSAQQRCLALSSNGRTPAFQAENQGSIPCRVTVCGGSSEAERSLIKRKVAGSNPALHTIYARLA